jgi:hypothetical protein
MKKSANSCIARRAQQELKPAGRVLLSEGFSLGHPLPKQLIPHRLIFYRNWTIVVVEISRRVLELSGPIRSEALCPTHKSEAQKPKFFPRILRRG